MKCSVLLVVCMINVVFATLYEGDPCQLGFNEPGVCVRLSQCPSAIRMVRSRQHPKTCSYIRSIPIVCCPTSTEPLYPRLSERKCQIYKTLATAAPPPYYRGSRSPSLPGLEESPTDEYFIIGGVPTLAKEFPHMAALGFSNGIEKNWLCGGSLISERFVLTAAHCLFSKAFGALQWVRLGTLHLTSSSSTSKDYLIHRRIRHPRYKPPSRYYDIGLVELARPAILSDHIRPACLPAVATIDPTVQLIATGWGLTQAGGPSSDFLQKVDLGLYTKQECETAYEDWIGTKLSEGIMHKGMFCAGGRSDQKDTCQGDSGGPIQIQDGDTSIVVGITSFGKSCGFVNIPGVYTRVAPYVPWIENIVWPDEY